MQFDDKSISRDIPQNIIIENRSRMSISGVSDVENFDENSVVLYTNRGLLTVRGTALHIERLSLETGELAVEGTIDGIEYSDNVDTQGFWSRLFR
ncbi:MAG: sporulation protein YabP [Oscillospiraceae bacterium]|nr:sporulation protein YabP [Oscillospiraceae bacterium]MBQ6902320.1 sporulation protein YabP [Oscillospiraceae bacterium]